MRVVDLDRGAENLLNACTYAVVSIKDKRILIKIKIVNISSFILKSRTTVVYLAAQTRGFTVCEVQPQHCPRLQVQRESWHLRQQVAD